MKPTTRNQTRVCQQDDSPKFTKYQCSSIPWVQPPVRKHHGVSRGRMSASVDPTCLETADRTSSRLATDVLARRRLSRLDWVDTRPGDDPETLDRGTVGAEYEGNLVVSLWCYCAEIAFVIPDLTELPVLET